MVLDSDPRPGLLLNTKNNPTKNKKPTPIPAPTVYMNQLICETEQSDFLPPLTLQSEEEKSEG